MVALCATATVAAAEKGGPELPPTLVLDPLPEPVSNNAVVGVATDDDEYLVSFSGLGAGRTHDDTLATTWIHPASSRRWSEAGDVPGGVGRLASTATAASELAYVFGGYTVAEDGSEVSTPWVHAFDPASGTFTERASMPVPVDDSLALTYKDRYIYLVSGWHDSGNVNLVQLYDTQTDSWVQATPTPGPAVFGQAGGIVGNTIVYCDGVRIETFADRRRNFAATDKCLLGVIDPENPRRIDWRDIPSHPGPARYRMAATGSERLNAIVFVGGSDNPYNYDGIGYDGAPSQPVPGILVFDLDARRWDAFTPTTPATMDHRALLEFDGRFVTVGGMLADQETTSLVLAYQIEKSPKR
ncbi:MAG: galactose oxidase [Woeseiaceae bacterium]|nr:galactose oxidase [Woeseiaceae bacterium]